MIRIERVQKLQDGTIIQPSSDWLKESKKRTDVLLANGKHAKFDEQFYRKDTVKRALSELFHNKCAYCESKVEAFEVEHFRPKGKVHEDPTHSGYYWLAYQWENLYRSCLHCNQKRRDIGSFEEPLDGRAVGKGTQFPLLPTSVRARASTEVESEQPLLLDPCADQPEEHLSYDVAGHIYSKGDSQRGEASIKVHHLFRTYLIKERKARLQEFLEVLRSGDATERFLADDAPYAGMCRHVRRDPEAFGVVP